MTHEQLADEITALFTRNGWQIADRFEGVSLTLLVVERDGVRGELSVKAFAEPACGPRYDGERVNGEDEA